MTLIESHQRKAVFLREASRELPNVRVLGRRAEESRRPGGSLTLAGKSGDSTGPSRGR